MVALDWIFLMLLLLSLAIGAWRGLVYEVLSLATWVAAFLLAQWFSPAAANYLPMAGSSETIRYAAGFVLVFIAAVFAGAMLTWLVSRMFQLAGLRPADRVLGAVFGVMRGVVVALAAAVLVSMTPIQGDAWWTESVGAAWATATVKGLKPVLPQQFGRYLP
ncbi:MAG: CvpA family protein [Betaproteobacteria bacterium]